MDSVSLEVRLGLAISSDGIHDLWQITLGSGMDPQPVLQEGSNLQW